MFFEGNPFLLTAHLQKIHNILSVGVNMGFLKLEELSRSCNLISQTH